MNLEVKDGSFYINEEKFTLLSGAIHYFRVVPEYWRDRLTRLKACGLNTVETYIAWNIHEPHRGQYQFDGMADFEAFLSIAEELGLYVIVRPGPFICAEWEMGGFPAWMNEIEGIQFRRMNQPYLNEVDRYFDAVIPKIVPHLITNGGTVIAVQVENEYGGFGIEDKKYLTYLRDGLIVRGIDVPLFTSDGTYDGSLERGCIDDVMLTANFGSKHKEAFKRLRALQPDIPPICMEFWNAWFDQWGMSHHTRDTQSVIDELSGILEEGGGFNLYMFHGGTNFGFMNGSNCNPDFCPTVTSYDYGAPLNEYGGYTDTYMAIRSLLTEFTGKEPMELPPENPRRGYGRVTFTNSVSVLDHLNDIGKTYRTDKPYNMEYFDQMYGFISYTVDVKEISGLLSIGVPHDRAMIFGDGGYLGLMERDGQMDKIEIRNISTLQLLVENQGHINYGRKIHDKKGIIDDIKIGDQVIHDITIHTLPMEHFNELKFDDCKEHIGPAIYKGTFEVDHIADTFFSFDGFSKGNVFINGFNIGRYWKKGPAKTMYIPAPILKEGKNEVIVFDLYGGACPFARLIDEPSLVV